LSSTAHTIHLVLTIFTCGLWGIVWILHALLAPRNPQAVTYTVPPGADPAAVQAAPQRMPSNLTFGNKVFIAVVIAITAGPLLIVFILNLINEYQP